MSLANSWLNLGEITFSVLFFDGSLGWSEIGVPATCRIKDFLTYWFYKKTLKSLIIK